MRDKVYFQHILDSIGRIEQYVDSLSKDEFMRHFMVQDAVLRNLEIIGEASSKLSQPIKDKYATVPWRDIKAMRNYVAHEYFAVDMEAVWNTVVIHLPILKENVLSILNDVEP